MADSSQDPRVNGPGVPAQQPLPLPQPRPSQPRAVAPTHFAYTLDGWIKIVSTRMLSLLAVVGAIAIFGYAIWDPLPVRAWTAGAYAVTCLWPTIWLYMRRE